MEQKYKILEWFQWLRIRFNTTVRNVIMLKLMNLLRYPDI